MATKRDPDEVTAPEPLKTDPPPTKDVTQVSMTIWDVSVAGVDVGYVEDIEIEEKRTLKPRVLKQLGEMKLGDRLTGIEIMIKGKFRQTGAAQLALFYPWNTTAVLPLAMAPVAMYGDLYDYAQQVVLHPRYMGSVVTADRTFNKAVISAGLKQKSDAKDDDSLDFEMVVYPDRTQLPNIVLGNVGSATIGA
jgi:hypothetical protein